MYPGVFSGRAAAYRAGRQGYAPRVFEILAQRFPSAQFPVLAEMGSGTGIFTRQLLKLGYETYAVEIESGMRAAAEEELGGHPLFHSVAAPAEETGLASGSTDLICAATSFHWFDLARFSAECRRILRGDGQVVIVCNARRLRNPFDFEQHRLFQQFLPAYESLDHGVLYIQKHVEEFFAPGFVFESIPFDLVYGSEAFLNRCLSSSYSLREGEEGFAEYVKELRALIARYENNGEILAANDTLLWYGRPA